MIQKMPSKGLGIKMAIFEKAKLRKAGFHYFSLHTDIFVLGFSIIPAKAG